MTQGLLIFLLLLGSSAGAHIVAVQPRPEAAVQAAPLSGAARVALVDLPSADLYAVHGTFESPAEPRAVWGVLSDYQSLAGVVKGLLSSRVLERKGAVVVLEQVMEGHFLIFGRTFRLRLMVQEQAPWSMNFSEIGPGPFRSYQGSWRITPSPTGSTVDYSLTVSRGDMAPRFLERSLFQDNAAELLRDLSREVQRRAGLAKAGALAVPAASAPSSETLEKIALPGADD